MPRNMSFALTTEQFKNRTKTVTRRLGWKFLKPGDQVMGCVKCMGLRPGEGIERLGKIEILDVRREPLSYIQYDTDDVIREGFPGISTEAFVKMFCQHMGVHPDKIITRIEFKYL